VRSPADISQAQAAKHSSASNEWFTPPHIIQLARAVMDGIDLDPASSKVANRAVGATRIFTKAADPPALRRPWRGRVWLNPPGGCLDANDRPVKNGKSSAKRWWEKLVTEYVAGRVSEALFLGFSLDCLQNTQDAAPGLAIMDYPICIPAQRIRFISGETGLPERQPTHANVIAYLPARTTNGSSYGVGYFCRLFSEIGRCRPRSRT
jgi:hypothetical protein